MNTDEYEGHTPGPWTVFEDDNGEAIIFQIEGKYCTVAYDVCGDYTPQRPAHGNRRLTANLIAAAPDLLAEVKRLREELDKQMEYIEWLEEFAPKAGEYNLPWDAYELAKGIHWTQMEEEE